MKRWVFALGLSLLVFLSPQTLRAQLPPLPPNPPAVPEEPKQEEVKEKLKMLRTWKLIDELQLTQEQALKFFPLLSKYDTEREKLEAQKRQNLKKLKELLKSEKSSDKKIKQLLAQLEKNNQELEKSREEFLTELAGVLSLRQQAKMIFFEERFRRELREIIQRVRHKMGPELRQPGPPVDMEMRLQQRIDRLQRKIQQMQRRLDSLQKKRR